LGYYVLLLICTNFEKKIFFLFNSSGAGASAVFIALDILLHQIREEKQINALETIFKMRLCRTEMVQNLVGLL